MIKPVLKHKELSRSTGIESFGDYTADELLAYLAGLEQSANHPIADGILAQAKKGKCSAEGSDWNPSAFWYRDRRDDCWGEMADRQSKRDRKYQTTIDPDQLNKYQEQGNTISYLVKGNQVEGLVALGDKIKPEAVKNSSKH